MKNKKTDDDESLNFWTGIPKAESCLIRLDFYLRKSEFSILLLPRTRNQAIVLSFQAVCEANGWKKFVIWGSETLSASHLAKRKFTFFPFTADFFLPSNEFFLSQLTKIVILLRNHIYMFLCCSRLPSPSQLLSVNLCTAMADFFLLFEQFIYFILRCACFSRVRLHRHPSEQLMCRGYAVKRSSTTISWLFGNQLAVSFLLQRHAWTSEESGGIARIHWKSFRISFSLSDFSFPFSQDIYSPVFRESAQNSPAKAQQQLRI